MPTPPPAEPGEINSEMGEWFTFIGTVITDGAAQFAEAIAAFTDMGGGDQIDWRHAQVERREAFVVAGRGNVRY